MLPCLILGLGGMLFFWKHDDLYWVGNVFQAFLTEVPSPSWHSSLTFGFQRLTKNGELGWMIIVPDRNHCPRDLPVPYIFGTKLPIYQVTRPWFQIYRDLEDEGLVILGSNLKHYWLAKSRNKPWIFFYPQTLEVTDFTWTTNAELPAGSDILVVLCCMADWTWPMSILHKT